MRLQLLNLTRVLMIAAEDELNECRVWAFTDPKFDLETEISAVLSREPDNALGVTNLKPKEMKEWFIEAITGD